MVEVYISRYGAKSGDGDKIKWEIGEKAIFIGRSGARYPVTIASGFVKSADAASGGLLCLEVTFNDEHDVKRCVPANRVEPESGFPPIETLEEG